MNEAKARVVVLQDLVRKLEREESLLQAKEQSLQEMARNIGQVRQSLSCWHSSCRSMGALGRT